MMDAYIEIVFDNDRKVRLDVSRTTVSERTDWYYEETDKASIESSVEGCIVAFKLFRDGKIVGYRRLQTPMTVDPHDGLSFTWDFHLLWT